MLQTLQNLFGRCLGVVLTFGCFFGAGGLLDFLVEMGGSGI